LVPPEVPPRDATAGENPTPATDQAGPERESLDEKFAAKNGFYLTGAFVYQAIEGDFNGKKVLIGPDAILVPKIDPGLGFSLGFGGRSERASFEFTYVRTVHDTNFGGLQSEAVFNAVNLDFKIHMMLESRLQPHILLGLAFPWLEVKDLSVNADGDVGNASFFGIGGNFGGGFTYFLNPQLGLFATGGYRLATFLSAEGVEGVSGSLDKGLNASGWFANFGVSFTF